MNPDIANAMQPDPTRRDADRLGADLAASQRDQRPAERAVAHLGHGQRDQHEHHEHEREEGFVA